MAGGQMRVSEYLNISRKADQITYTATVLNQNRGEGISFEMTQSDSMYVFENPGMIFPKRLFTANFLKQSCLYPCPMGARKDLPINCSGNTRTRLKAIRLYPIPTMIRPWPISWGVMITE